MVGVTEEKIAQIPGDLTGISRAEIEFPEVHDIVHADQGCVRQRVTAVFEVTLDDVGTERRARRRPAVTGSPQVLYRKQFRPDGDEHVVAEVSPEIPELARHVVLERDFQNDLVVVWRHEHRQVREINRPLADEQHPVNANRRVRVIRLMAVVHLTVGHKSPQTPTQIQYASASPARSRPRCIKPDAESGRTICETVLPCAYCMEIVW